MLVKRPWSFSISMVVNAEGSGQRFLTNTVKNNPHIKTSIKISNCWRGALHGSGGSDLVNLNTICIVIMFLRRHCANFRRQRAVIHWLSKYFAPSPKLLCFSSSYLKKFCISTPVPASVFSINSRILGILGHISLPFFLHGLSIFFYT
jgi:hypothetical protein